MESIDPNKRQIDFAAIQNLRLEARMQRGVRWFYWIAVLSLVNTIMAVSGANWVFGVGLGVTQVIDAIGAQLVGPVRLVVIAVNFIFAGLFALFGLLGSRHQSWAILLGMILYVLDGLLLLGLMGLGGGLPILGLLVHAYATYHLILGFNAARELVRNRPGQPGPPGPDLMSTMGNRP